MKRIVANKRQLNRPFGKKRKQVRRINSKAGKGRKKTNREISDKVVSSLKNCEKDERPLDHGGIICFDDLPSTEPFIGDDVKLFCSDTFESFVNGIESTKTTSFIDKRLLRRLTQEGYIRITQVQYAAIPKLRAGLDAMIRCETGSGKTLAYIVPAIQRLIDLPQEFGSAGSLKGKESVSLFRSLGTQVLVVAPTRELVNQIIDVAVRLSIPFPQIVTTAVTGGEKRKSEKARLRKGVAFLGTTVGRLCDHLETTSSFKIENLRMLILDEADRLLDMGFEKQLRWIVKKLKSITSESRLNDIESCHKTSDKTFQTILVSATLTPSVKKLADFALHSSAEFISVGSGQSISDVSEQPTSALRGALNTRSISLSIPTRLKQFYVEVCLKTRSVTLASLLLEKARNGKVVVFLSNRESVEFYHSLFQTCRWPNERYFKSRREIPSTATSKREQGVVTCGENDESSSDEDVQNDEKKKEELEPLMGNAVFFGTKLYKLHGSMPQADRLGYLTDFNKRERSAVLFTTDVAARGLNLKGVQWIVQLEAPQEIEEYAHRVGRTGRLGEEGTAFLFLLEHETGYVDYLRQANVSISPVSELQLLQPLYQDFLPDDIRVKRLQNISSFLNSFLSKQVEADIELLHGARRSFTATYRSYRCYAQELKKYFDVKLLHTGHLASAFFLNEAPSTIGNKCRRGVMANAARDVLMEKNRLKNSETGNTRLGKATVSSRLSRIAGGVAHDENKMVRPKQVTLRTARQFLHKDVKLRRQGRRNATRSGEKGSSEVKRKGIMKHMMSRDKRVAHMEQSDVLQKNTQDPVLLALTWMKKNHELL